MEGEEDQDTTNGQVPLSYGALARIPSFRKLWLGDIFSQTADRMTLVAVTVLAYGEDSSALGVSSVLAAYFIPAVVFGIPGGIAADKYPRRTMMVLAESVRVGIALCLVFLGEGIWLLPLVLAFSSLTYLFYPSRQASIPCLVPEKALMAANAAVSLNLILGFALGPAAAGLIVASGGVKWALLSAAIVMACGITIIYGIRDEAVCMAAREAEEGPSQVFREALSALKGKATLILGFVLLGLIMFAVGGGAVGLVIHADEVLEMGEEGFSLLLSALAVGTLVGAASMGSGYFEGRRIGIVVVGVFFAGAMMGFFPLTNIPWIALAIMFLLGISAAMVMVPFITMLHEHLGDHVMGTNFGLMSVGLTAPMVCGIAVSGLIIDASDVANVFFYMGILLVAGGIAGWASSMILEIREAREAQD
jgi:MFS family permease